MNDSNFVLVYEIDISSLYKTLAVVLFLAVVILGALCVAFAKVEFDREEQRWYLLPPILFLIIVFVLFFRGYIENINLVSSKRFSYVEGTVTNFVPMPYYGHAEESFTVSGVPFHYAGEYYDLTPGFHHTASHGGPIKDGIYVRIWYIGNEITKLEIRQE
jgi:hypothetical protein